MKCREKIGASRSKRHLWEGYQRRVSGLHSLSVGKSHRDAVLGGDFVGAGFVPANEVAHADKVYNGSAVAGWSEGGN